MSTGISIATEPDVEIDGYFQNFAAEFENINFLLKQDGCDLTPYLYCPESWQEEESMKEYGASDEEIAYMKMITTEEYFPIAEVFGMVRKAIELASGYDEDSFEYGKEPFLSEMEELCEELAPHADKELRVNFVRA